MVHKKDDLQISTRIVAVFPVIAGNTISQMNGESPYCNRGRRWSVSSGNDLHCIELKGIGRLV